MKNLMRRPNPPRYPAYLTRHRKGHCYELAARGILDFDPTWTLVHGRAAFWCLKRLPYLISHAWLEKTGHAYDPTIDQMMTVDEYAARHSAIAERRYSEGQARKQVLAHEHWGPWHPCDEITVALSRSFATEEKAGSRPIRGRIRRDPAPSHIEEEREGSPPQKDRGTLR